MIQIVRSDSPAHLGEPRERSDEMVKLNQPQQPHSGVWLHSMGVTRSSEGLFAVIEFEMKEVIEPDTDAPKTIAQLAEEQRQFNVELEGYVDVDLPFDN